MNSKIGAGIVTFNPDIDRLIENIKAIYIQVNKIILFDNGSNNLQEIKECVGQYSKCILINSLTNKGIAHALNCIARAFKRDHYKWLLTLDQDSVVSSNLIMNYKKFLRLPKLGQLCCKVVDRNVKDERISEDFSIRKTNRCMTSGSLINLDALTEVGGFDESLFIDCVDYDICDALKIKGYETYEINFVGLLQEVGKATYKNIGFKNILLYNHNEYRHFYIARNSIILARRYSEESLIKSIGKEIKISIKILIGEENKKNKIYAIIKGLNQGFKVNKKRPFYKI